MTNCQNWIIFCQKINSRVVYQTRLAMSISRKDIGKFRWGGCDEALRYAQGKCDPKYI